MSKIETSNTWEEGLVMDLNPLSTPNNVLTDCVNGTFITYNGNEFSLQNDQGNYKLEYCRLSPNYIPVGIKEYGDILYIVSHNPLNNSVEIGSYPSPLMITVPDNKHNNNDFNSIIDSQILDKNLTEGVYTQLMENADNVLFNGEDYKLNPGDEYCLQTEGEEPPYKYETIEYSILDEDSNVHNITNKIKVDKNGDPKDFEHVAWTVPGWLSVKARLAELSVAGINIRSFYVPKTENESKTAHFAFNLRLNVNDEYLLEKNKEGVSILNEWCTNIEKSNLEDVRFRVYIEKEEDGQFKSIYDSEFIEFGITDKNSAEIPNNFFLNEFDWTEWYRESRVLWKNISGKIEGLKADDKVMVRMIPVLYEPEYNYKIVYDNLEQKLLFDLNAVEDSEWDLGNSLYQFYVSSDSKAQYIYTDISGPMISSFPVNLYADIYDINQNLILSNWMFEDYSGIGENLLQIPFDKIVQEEIYVIKYKFAPSVDEIGTFPTSLRFLITSKVFNDFTNVMVYDKEIRLDQWLKQYWQHVDVDFKLEYEPIDTTPKKILDTVVFENINNDGLPTEADQRYLSGEKYNTFFPHENSGLSDSVKFRKGFLYDFVYKTIVNSQCLQGPIWDSFKPSTSLKMMDYSTNKKVDFPKYSDFNSIEISSYLELLCKYQKQGMPFEWANAEFWYLSDSLSKFGTKEVDAKLTDYMLEMNVKIYGDASSVEGEFSEDDVVSVSGKLLYKNVEPSAWNEQYRFSVSRLGERVEDGNAKTTDIIYPYLKDCMKNNKFPCMLVKANYVLKSETDYYKMTQIIAGGPHDGNILDTFVFSGKEKNQVFTRYYIAFLEQNDDMPVLIPLTAGNNGVKYFKNFCDNVSILLTQNPNLVQTDRYILNSESTSQCGGRLTIYNQGEFDNLIYKDHDLRSFSVRNDIINELKSLGDIKNVNILINSVDIESAMFDNSHLIFDEELVSVSFDVNKFPYITEGSYKGMSEVTSDLLRLQSHTKDDFEQWNDTVQSSSSFLSNKVYCNNTATLGDSFLQNLNDGYSYPYLRLTGKSYVKTDGITDNITKHAWKSESYDSIINSDFKDKAMWYITNADGNHSWGSDHHMLLGGCLASNATICLDMESGWNWITGEN